MALEYELYQMKIPTWLGERLRKCLSATLEQHAQDVARLADYHEDSPTPRKSKRKVSAQRDELLVRGRKITIHNLIRVVLANGIPAVESPKNALALLSKHGTPYGRPRSK